MNRKKKKEKTEKRNYYSLQVVPLSIISTFCPKVTQGHQQVTQPANNQDWLNSEPGKKKTTFIIEKQVVGGGGVFFQ